MDCFECGTALTEEEIRQFSLDPEFRVNSRWDEEGQCDVPLCDLCMASPSTPSISSEEEEEEEEDEDEIYEVYCDECGHGIYGACEEDYTGSTIVPLCESCNEPADDVLYE
jgi:hypothetical protein